MKNTLTLTAIPSLAIHRSVDMKWCMTMIYDCSSHKYHASVNTEKGIVDFWDDVDYNTLKKAIEDTTGIVIPDRKRMKFEKLSEFTKIATVDNTGAKVGDYRVSLEDIRNGWRPLLKNDVPMAVIG